MRGPLDEALQGDLHVPEQRHNRILLEDSGEPAEVQVFPLENVVFLSIHKRECICVVDQSG